MTWGWLLSSWFGWIGQGVHRLVYGWGCPIPSGWPSALGLGGRPSVCVGPAGVEVSHEECLVHRVALVFVHFPHDEILDVGKWVGLVHVWKVFEW